VWTDGTRRIHEVSEGVTPTVEQAIEFYHPEDRETVEQAVETALETGESFEHEVRLITAKDRQRWVRVQGKVLDTEESRTVRGFIQDITDRKEREQELEQTHELLQHTERIADVGSWEIDTDTMDVFWSENLFEILGIDADDEPSLDEALDVYHEDDRRVVESAVENALETGESFDIEVRFRRPDGEIRWLRVQGTPTVEDGEVVTLRGAVEDITDHKEIEAELRQERDLFEGIVETSPIGITVVDADGTLSLINDRAEEIYGRSSEEIEEFTHDDPRWGLIDEDGTPLEAGSTAFDRVLSQEEPIYDQVVSLRQPDGDRVWVSVNGAPQWNDDGTLRQAIFAFEDITERRELETRVTEILGRVTDAFYALDEEFQFSHVNDRAEELLQASEEELLGEKLWEQYPEAADIDEVQDAFQTAMETQLPQSYELYFEPLEFHVEATVYPSQSGVSVYFRDITDQRTYEREIEQKNERLEEFARVISHDLRNPLNIARGRLALAKEEFESEDLDTVDTALDRMEQLIENTLSLVRKGDIIDSTAPVDLDDAVESAWAMVEGTGEHDECLQLESSGSETIQADYDRLCQLFENLFRNAIEHSDGDVTVRVGRLDDGLYIEDNGPGIPEDAREEVFQVGNSTSPEGTGFGLSIVKNIAEAHGWEITITEATAGGARFEITGVELGVK
jgi:PAS domain S-box-containing protein